MTDGPDLTDRQEELLAALPASKQRLADRLGVAPTTVEGHLNRIRDKGISLEYDQGANQWFLHNEQKVRRVSTKHTGSKTREANDLVTELEKQVLRRLERKEPLVASQDPTPGNEDIVLHLTDLHIGDVVEDERGREIYNTSIAVDVVDHVTRKALDIRELMSSVATVDTLHLLWGGDMITNENIYDGQAFDIDGMLLDQMTAAVGALTRQVKTFAEEFDAVNVVAQPGNHGKTRASGVSKQANMDLVTYRWIDDRLRESTVDNVNFVTSEATWHKTFPLRGGEWTGFLTHGQDSLKHADSTAASSRDWRGWLNEFGFDIAYRGHYHESRREPVQNGPFVIESPSPKPPDGWVSRVGQGSVDGHHKRVATIHGVSDDRPLTWEYPLDDHGMHA